MIRRTLGTFSRSRRRTTRPHFRYVLNVTREHGLRRRPRREAGPSGPYPRPLPYTRLPASAMPRPIAEPTPKSAIRVLEREDA